MYTHPILYYERFRLSKFNSTGMLSSPDLTLLPVAVTAESTYTFPVVLNTGGRGHDPLTRESPQKKLR